MRTFSYFLFENFDPEREAENSDNPRRILNTRADALLSRVADFPPLSCLASMLWEEFGGRAVELLSASGRWGTFLPTTPRFSCWRTSPLCKAFLPLPPRWQTGFGICVKSFGISPELFITTSNQSATYIISSAV